MCLLEALNCELLDKSQTLLGVLLTLAVLCIFSQRSSNYILNIWVSQSERSTNMLDELLSILKDKIKLLRTNEKYVILQEIQKGKIPSDTTVRNQAVRILFNISVMQKMDNINFNNLNLKIHALTRYNEQYIAPLYTFLYGILIFIADEVFRLAGYIPEWCVFGIYMFTILSIIYFVIIWMVFMNHPAPTYKGSKWIQTIISFKKTVGNLLFSLMVLIVGVSISAGCTLMVDFNRVESIFSRIVVTILIIGLPVFLFGGIKILISKSKGNYSTLYVVGHLLTLLLMAAGYTGVLKLMETVPGFSTSIQACMNSFSDLTMLRFVIVMFVLLNAVLLPLFFPLIKVDRLKSPYRKELRRRINNVDEISKKIDKEMPALCQRIVEGMAMGDGGEK